MVELLADRHEVTLLAPSPRKGAMARPDSFPGRLLTYRRPGPLGRALGILRSALAGLPLQTGLYAGVGLGRALRRLAPSADLVLLQLVRLAPRARDLEGTPQVVDLIDSLALSTGRRALFDRRWWAPVLRWEAARLARWERRVVAFAAGALVVSERDARAIREGLPEPLARRLHVVPLAVEAPPPPAEPPHPQPPVLAVTGNLGYFPTLEGTLWFLREVWPVLAAERPGLRLVIAGARPPRALVREAARRGAELLPSPPDLRGLLATVTVALAPMRSGAGLPLKVLEAWAAGVPVVATSWAAEGTAARPGVDLLVADGREAWCDAIRSLLDDPALAAKTAASGRRHLAERFATGAVRARLEEALADALEAPG
jgi:glycosyltransferase involved in cell wall biosynthesis